MSNWLNIGGGGGTSTEFDGCARLLRLKHTYRVMDRIGVQSQLTIYGCSNVSTTNVGKSCENVGTLRCCNIFQESFKNVTTTLPQNVIRKNLHNIRATFIHNVTIRYSQCCGNLSAIWENHIRTLLRKKVMPTAFHWSILCSTSA